MFVRNDHLSTSRRLISGLTAMVFIVSMLCPPLAGAAPAQLLGLPAPGAMVLKTPAFAPALIRGVRIDPDNPLMFNFIIDTGDSRLNGPDLKAEAGRMIKYFLAALTVPEDQIWVNLSPYEEGRVVGESLGRTEMGRDLLAQDYLLKQLSASLLSPDESTGRDYWQRVYQRARDLFGTTNVPVDTFNKIWIVPQEAVVYEDEQGAYVGRNHLKVMLEADYLALEANLKGNGPVVTDAARAEAQETAQVTADVVREVLLPEIEREVNNGATFANLRQMYHAMILATWYKTALKESLLGRVYANQNKTRGVDLEDPSERQAIYDQYLAAFRVGVYDAIKEDLDPVTNQILPRRYFSGGFGGTLSSAVRIQAFVPSSPDIARELSASSPASTIYNMKTLVSELGENSPPVAALNALEDQFATRVVSSAIPDVPLTGQQELDAVQELLPMLDDVWAGPILHGGFRAWIAGRSAPENVLLFPLPQRSSIPRLLRQVIANMVAEIPGLTVRGEYDIAAGDNGTRAGTYIRIGHQGIFSGGLPDVNYDVTKQRIEDWLRGRARFLQSQVETEPADVVSSPSSDEMGEWPALVDASLEEIRRAIQEFARGVAALMAAPGDVRTLTALWSLEDKATLIQQEIDDLRLWADGRRGKIWLSAKSRTDVKAPLEERQARLRERLAAELYKLQHLREDVLPGLNDTEMARQRWRVLDALRTARVQFFPRKRGEGAFWRRGLNVTLPYNGDVRYGAHATMEVLREVAADLNLVILSGEADPEAEVFSFSVGYRGLLQSLLDLTGGQLRLRMDQYLADRVGLEPREELAAIQQIRTGMEEALKVPSIGIGLRLSSQEIPEQHYSYPVDDGKKTGEIETKQRVLDHMVRDLGLRRGESSWDRLSFEESEDKVRLTFVSWVSYPVFSWTKWSDRSLSRLSADMDRWLSARQEYLQAELARENIPDGGHSDSLSSPVNVRGGEQHPVMVVGLGEDAVTALRGDTGLAVWGIPQWESLPMALAASSERPVVVGWSGPAARDFARQHPEMRVLLLSDPGQERPVSPLPNVSEAAFSGDWSVLKEQVRSLTRGDGKISSSPIASDNPVGGIDLNAELLDLQIKRDGRGVPLPLPQQPLEGMQIEGVIPLILEITPVPSLPMLLGMTVDAEGEGNTAAARNQMLGREPEELSWLR